MKLGFIGLGNMATAIIGGVLAKKLLAPSDILGADGFEEAVLKAEKSFGISCTRDNCSVAKQSDILFVAVKPQIYAAVLEEIKSSIQKETIIVSIAPGKTIAWLEEKLGAPMKIARCMPNTPALVGEGCTGVCFHKLVQKDERKKVLEVLESFGKAYVVPEHLMNTVVGVSGSSPAYVFLFIEAMADAAVADGMPRKQAYEFAAQSVLGSAKMVLETGKHPGELKDMVCSPGGTTIEAVCALEEKGFRAAVIKAQRACVEKSKKL